MADTKLSGVRLWLPTLAQVSDLKWPAYCVCCSAPADGFREWTGSFGTFHGGENGQIPVKLSLPYGAACLQHERYAAEIPGAFLWEEMRVVAWVIFSLLWSYVAIDTGAHILALGASLSLLGSLGTLMVKAIRHRRRAANAQAAMARSIRPACVPVNAHTAVRLSEITDLLGSRERTCALSFAKSQYGRRFAGTNGLRVFL